MREVHQMSRTDTIPVDFIKVFFHRIVLTPVNMWLRIFLFFVTVFIYLWEDN